MVAHYRLEEKIGQGGMGIVYRASDTRLKRTAAIKVLSPELVSHPDRRARFEREAQAAAALNHANIAVIYEIGEHEGLPFIAMEYVEGKSLRALADLAPLPAGRAVRIGLQIAAGVGRAHQSGIVHRDLKPENVIVTPDGQVKILDFGLAKLWGEPLQAGPGQNASRLETISREGRILGTAAYMSPEQVRGEGVDPRSDLFSFGILLYELVTGRPPFDGPTAMDTLSSILRDAPAPARTLNSALPAEMERILSKCLEKDPEDRYQSSADLVVDLRRLERETDSHSGGALRVPSAAPMPANRLRLMLLFGIGAPALIAVATLGAMALGWFEGGLSSPPIRSEPRRVTSNPAENWVTDGDISPDGTLLAYADQVGIHVEEIESGNSIDLPLPEGTAIYSLAWFPDGASLVTSETSAEGETALWSIPIRNGTRTKLRVNARQASVSPDGRRIAFLGGPTAWSTREIWVMDAGGGDARTLLAAEGLELFSRPSWSPGSSRIAFVRYRIAEAGLEASLESVDAAGSGAVVRAASWRASMEDSPPVGEAAIAWLPDGRILMARGESLYAVKADPETGQADGEPVKAATWSGFDLHELSISADGRRLAFQNKQLQSDIYVGKLSDRGRRLLPPERLTLSDARDSAPAWSHDGQEILFHSDRSGNQDILSQRVQRSQATPLVAGPAVEVAPGLSPDGRWILYWQMPPTGAEGTEPWRLMRAPKEGGPAETVLETALTSGRPSFCCTAEAAGTCLLAERKGGLLVFSLFSPETGRGLQLATVPVSGGEPPVAWWDLSPDGEQVALLSPEGRVRVMNLEGTLEADFILTGAGGFERLTWAADGEGFFVSGRDPGAILLHSDLKGATVTLWETTRTRFLETSASPDGAHLAVAVESLDSDIWLVEGP